MSKDIGGDFSELNEDARGIWDANAEWWDDRIGDGNAFQCELIEPATERLLGVKHGEVLLDIGCGAGRFARRMAELGGHVVAFDFSKQFIERAKERTPADMKNVEYHVIDATDKEQVLGLGVNSFDGAVASMALMDIASIEPLMSALREMLKPGARFVFSVMHPCFQTAEITKFMEEVEADGRVTLRSGVKVTKYLTPTAWKGLGIIGQPEEQYYFHRPLSVLFGACFREGFVMDGMEEPAFKEKSDNERVLQWRNMPEIPPALVGRMRLLQG